MKLKKRITAAAVAMIMAVSTMAMSSSAANDSSSGNGMSVTGLTEISGSNGIGTSFAYNNTSTTRYMCAQVNIYKKGASGFSFETQDYNFKDAVYGGRVTAEARADKSVCYRIEASGVLYNSPGTVMGGQYGSASVSVRF